MYFRLSARIVAEVSLWLCDLFHFSDGAAYCHDDTRDGKICSKMCTVMNKAYRYYILGIMFDMTTEISNDWFIF